MTRRITLSDREIVLLDNLLCRITEYFARDDRPDHGLAKLKPYRDALLPRCDAEGLAIGASLESGAKRDYFFLAGKFARLRRGKK